MVASSCSRDSAPNRSSVSWRCSTTRLALRPPWPLSRRLCSCSTAMPSSSSSWSPLARRPASQPAFGQRLRHNAELIEDASVLDVPARLARALLRLGGEPGSLRLPEPGATIYHRLTEVELAGLVGATRESISKWLRSFERLGLIRQEDGHITLLRPAALQQRVF